MQPNIWVPVIKLKKKYLKKIHNGNGILMSNDTLKSYNPLNYKGCCEKYMGFPPKMAATEQKFWKVRIGLYLDNQSTRQRRVFIDKITNP